MSPKTDEIRSIIDSWSEPYRTMATRMYEAYYKEFRSLPASKSHHNAYPGGLKDHSLNGIQCVRVLYPAYERILKLMTGRDMPFTQERAEFVMFVHDFGKIYERVKKPFNPHYIVIFDMFREQNIKPDEEIINAIYHHHGGYGPSGDLTELAVFVHACDMWASQVLEKEEQ